LSAAERAIAGAGAVSSKLGNLARGIASLTTTVVDDGTSCIVADRYHRPRMVYKRLVWPPIPRNLLRPALVPVIELEPAKFALVQRELPTAHTTEQTELLWQQYWQAAIADRWLSLEPIFPGSWSVALESITTLDDIRKIITTIYNVNESLEEMSSLAGGYALADGNQCMWHAACCADLTDISTWQRLVTASCQPQWIAHTFVRSEISDGIITLFMQQEHDREETQSFSFACADVEPMFATAEQRVAEFRERLELALVGHVATDHLKALTAPR
jgi:hypothetical protein